MTVNNSLNSSGSKICSTISTESKVKASEEYGCSIPLPFFSHYCMPTAQTSPDPIEARRVKVKARINQLDFLFTQLYFLAHQHQHQNIPCANYSLPELAIEGSYLDENVASIITCLIQFMETVPKDKQTHLSKLVALLQASVPIADLICSLAEAPTKRMQSAIFEQLISLLNQQYQHLPVGSKMLIPAGYLTGNQYDLTRKGHAVLLELHKLEGGKVNLRLFNTGEGLEFHQLENSMFFPFTIENIEESLVNRDFFEKLCELGRQNDPEKPNKIDDLYWLLVWKFGFPERFCNYADVRYYDQGNANSCAHQCFMAWLKTTLDHEHAQLFCDFINYLVNDRMSKIKAISDKEKSNLHIQKPYTVYSFTLQKSLQLTLVSAAERIFQGSSIQVKIKRSTVDKITTYFEEHFANKTAFIVHPTKKIEKFGVKFKLEDIYIGKVPFSFQEMQTLRDSGLLKEFLNQPELRARLKDEVLSLNHEDIQLLCEISIWLEPLKKRLTSGQMSLQDTLKFFKSLKNNRDLKTLSCSIRDVIGAGYLSISEALNLTEPQKKNLDHSYINQLILDGTLKVSDLLSLKDEQIDLFRRTSTYYAIQSGAISWERALKLTDPEIKILEHRNIGAFIRSGKIPAEEAFLLKDPRIEILEHEKIGALIRSGKITVAEAVSLTKTELRWFEHTEIFEYMQSGKIDWRIAIKLDYAEVQEYFLPIDYKIHTDKVRFHEYFDKTHRNYHNPDPILDPEPKASE